MDLSACHELKQTQSINRGTLHPTLFFIPQVFKDFEFKHRMFTSIADLSRSPSSWASPLPSARPWPQPPGATKDATSLPSRLTSNRQASLKRGDSERKRKGNRREGSKSFLHYFFRSKKRRPFRDNPLPSIFRSGGRKRRNRCERGRQKKFRFCCLRFGLATVLQKRVQFPFALPSGSQMPSFCLRYN